MKNFLSGALALSLLASAGAVAAQPHDDHGRDQQGPGQQGHDQQGPAQQHGQPGQAAFNGHHTDWRKGSHLPTNYRDNRYVVSDWHARHLRAPPRGYHWVKADNDYVLAAVATGVIASIIAGH